MAAFVGGGAFCLPIESLFWVMDQWPYSLYFNRVTFILVMAGTLGLLVGAGLTSAGVGGSRPTLIRWGLATAAIGGLVGGGAAAIATAVVELSAGGFPARGMSGRRPSGVESLARILPLLAGIACGLSWLLYGRELREEPPPPDGSGPPPDP
ncbi:MAG: hypothetical protein L0216_10320 [Planctomycetales bacterium]|nr:hypothetical protein [Planctomycetales bacterium]